MTTRVLVPSGVLGLGFDRQALAAGVANQPDVICIDGGSTDSGPFYLGSGTSKYATSATRSQWRDLLIARHAAGVPLILGTAGTCGVDAMTDWMAAMTRELLAELGLSATIATVHCERGVSEVLSAYQSDHLHALPAAPAIDESVIGDCTHIVALAGVEPLQKALADRADIIIAGRTTDTAIIAALPLMRGEAAGAAWHAAKIAECGALCSTHPTSGVIQVDIDKQGFTVTALAKGAMCTPHSVSAHMLYENSDPIRLTEPGGVLDVSDAVYEDAGSGAVRVSGSRWLVGEDYTVKLEGARLAGFQSTVLAVLRNGHYVEHAEQWLEKLEGFLLDDIEKRAGLTANKEYTLEFRLIGVNSVFGQLEQRHALPVEVGVLAIVTADTEDMADDIARLINPFVLHYPLTDNEELPTFAFPYSPAQSNRGALYEFVLNHALVLRDAMQGFRITKEHCGALSSSQNGVDSPDFAWLSDVDTSDDKIHDASDDAAPVKHDARTDDMPEISSSSSQAVKSNAIATRSECMLSTRVDKVRSKNAGPFWVTVDVFCGSTHAYTRIVSELSTAQVAACFQQQPGAIKRFDLPELNVIKFSFPRPVIQGDRFDRDMHGAQYAELLGEMPLNLSPDSFALAHSS